MGLNFRKSVNLGKGFKVNLSGSGVGFSWGVPGFRVTKTATGKTRQTISIPGTGISYTSELGGKKTKSTKKTTAGDVGKTIAAAGAAAAVGAAVNSAKKSAPKTTAKKTAAKSEAKPEKQPAEKKTTAKKASAPVNYDSLKSIHRAADEAVDWQELLSSETPTDDLYDPEFWAYCHERAGKILDGDIDTYLEVIQDMNPYDDLLDLGGNFLFGTDSSDTMEVEFTAKSAEVMPSKHSIGLMGYNDLLQDYVCSVAVRAARDTFALLPVEFVKVHAVDAGKLVLSVRFDRKSFTRIRFSSADPSDIVEKFPHNMEFSNTRGFSEVEEID